MQGPASLHTLKENIEKNMKKTYFSPEVEVIRLNMKQTLMAGSVEKEDITDGPVDTIEDPTDDDLDW